MCPPVTFLFPIAPPSACTHPTFKKSRVSSSHQARRAAGTHGADVCVSLMLLRPPACCCCNPPLMRHPLVPLPTSLPLSYTASSPPKRLPHCPCSPSDIAGADAGDLLDERPRHRFTPSSLPCFRAVLVVSRSQVGCHCCLCGYVTHECLNETRGMAKERTGTTLFNVFCSRICVTGGGRNHHFRDLAASPKCLVSSVSSRQEDAVIRTYIYHRH